MTTEPEKKLLEVLLARDDEIDRLTERNLWLERQYNTAINMLTKLRLACDEQSEEMDKLLAAVKSHLQAEKEREASASDDR